MRYPNINYLTVEEIRQKASDFRSNCPVEISPSTIDQFLEHLIYDEKLHVVQSLPPGYEGFFESNSQRILLTDEGYEQCLQWRPRAIFTLGHEIGHWILEHGKNRSIVYPHPGDPEWQANWFSAELLMTYEVMVKEKLYTPQQIQNRFHVSAQAAEVRVSALSNMKKGIKVAALMPLGQIEQAAH